MSADAVTAAGLLAALVDTLMPGDAQWPAASVVGVQCVLAARLLQERGEEALAKVVDALNPMAAALDPDSFGLKPSASGSRRSRGGFTSQVGPNSDNEDLRVATVAAWEASDKDLFGWVRDAVYLAYYESPFVVQAINARGHTYKLVPHVTGYRLPQFDPDRDTPTHRRGGWLPTEAVRPVAVETLDLADQRTVNWGRKQ